MTATIETVAFVLREDGAAWRIIFDPRSPDKVAMMRFRSADEARDAINDSPDIPVVAHDRRNPKGLSMFR